jgi:protein-S-isoprenylcysteine O-methyltransferase Ste14
MLFVIIGVFAFFLMFLYDLNQIKENKIKFLNSFFIIGILILTVCSVFLIVKGIIKEAYNIFNIIGIIGSIIFFIFMFFALFINLPVKKTYVETGDKNITITTGLYALCRHPGVSAFFLCYFFLYLATKTQAMLFAWLVWSLLDIIYAFIQDCYIFPKTLSGYNEYRKNTPFLIPDLKHIRSFFGKKSG